MWLTSEYKRERKKLSLFSAAASFWSSFNRASVISTHSVGGLQSHQTLLIRVCVCVFIWSASPTMHLKLEPMSHKRTRAKSRRNIDAVKRAAERILEVTSLNFLKRACVFWWFCHQQTCTCFIAQAFLGGFRVFRWWHMIWKVKKVTTAENRNTQKTQEEDNKSLSVP